MPCYKCKSGVPLPSPLTLFLFSRYLLLTVRSQAATGVMKTLSTDMVMVLLIANGLLTLGAWIGWKPLWSGRSPALRRWWAALCWVEVSLMSMGILWLYLWQPHLPAPWLYRFYFLFNGILMAGMSCKLPAMGALLLMPLFRKKPVQKRLATMSLILSAGVLGVFLWGAGPGAAIPLTREITLFHETLPPAFDGFRIVQVADLHLGSYHAPSVVQRMARRAIRFDPDAVVLTGDLVNEHSPPKTAALLRLFHGRDASLAISGNHDYGDYTEWPSAEARNANLQIIRKAFSDGGFLLLENDHLLLVRGPDTLAFAGVGNYGEAPLPRHDDLEKATRGLPPAVFTILLSHDPQHWEKEIRHDPRFPLTLAGHTHGLQWGVTLAGIPFSMVYGVRKQWAGLYREENRYLYVNRGTGVIGMPFRIDMPPELTLITLRRPAP